MIIPESSHRHDVFDAPWSRWDENLPSPWSVERLGELQERINNIAGLAWNGKPNVRVIWPAWPVPPVETVFSNEDPGVISDYNERITMHWVQKDRYHYQKRARYRLFTQEYRYEGIDLETGLPAVKDVDLDIVLRRFVFEEYHVPEEGRINWKTGTAGHGWYSHLWSCGVHFESCCGGNEATKKGKLCLGLYREPGDRDIEELQRRIKLRDEWEAGHRPGEAVSQKELELEARAARDAEERGRERRINEYREAMLSSFATHGWKMFCDDPSRLQEGKYFDLARKKGNN